MANHVSSYYSNSQVMVDLTQSKFKAEQKNKLKVLHIEDDIHYQRLFKEYLKGTEYAGSEVISTDSIQEAEPLSQQYQPDVVISDLVLSDVQHKECIRQLLRVFGDKPIILLTGNGDTALARKAVGSGIQAYVEKDLLSSASLNSSILHAQEQFRLTQSMKYTIQNLHEKNRINEQVTRTISHDFRSPVSSMLGLLELMRHDPDNHDFYRQKAIDSGSHLLQSMEDMLALMHSPSEVKIDAEQIILQSCLDIVMMRLERSIDESGARIIADFSRIPYLRYSRIYLQGYLQNLISNAIKYSLPDVPPEIMIRSERNDEYICITVSDNGSGIDLQAHGDKIFGFKERFHNHVPGTGLGLFNIKNQIESLGGKIEVESTPGEGSIFTLFLREI